MTPRETAAIRVLLVSFEVQAIEVLSDVMHQLGIHIEVCADRKAASGLLCGSKYEGLIIDLRLEDDGLELLKNLPDFTSNRGVVSCAILNGAHQKASAFQAGANFVLERPLDTDTALRTIRAAYPLMVRERRRYFRCPVQTTAFVTCEDQPEFQATSVNISEAGMAILSPAQLKVGQNIQIRLRMPGKPNFIDVSGEICWADVSGRVGVQFKEISAAVAESLESWLLQRLEDMIPHKKGRESLRTQVSARPAQAASKASGN